MNNNIYIFIDLFQLTKYSAVTKQLLNRITTPDMLWPFFTGTGLVMESELWGGGGGPDGKNKGTALVDPGIWIVQVALLHVPIYWSSFGHRQIPKTMR